MPNDLRLSDPVKLEIAARHRRDTTLSTKAITGRMHLGSAKAAIVGGESGPGARPMAAEWVTDIRDQCLKAGVAFHFKQWGGVFKKRNGRLLEGRFWNDMPDAPAPAARPAQLDPVPA